MALRIGSEKNKDWICRSDCPLLLMLSNSPCIAQIHLTEIKLAGRREMSGFPTSPLPVNPTEATFLLFAS